MMMTTQDLIDSIMLDVVPRQGALVDFGITTQEHYEALYYPIRNGEITDKELDEALGNGKKLTKIAQNAKSNPHKEIVFSTLWDDLGPDDDENNPYDDATETDLGEPWGDA